MRKLIFLFYITILAGCIVYKERGAQPACATVFRFDCSKYDTMYITGLFQNKNEYFQNPSCECTDLTQGFSCVKIIVNDTIVLPHDSIASLAFELPLKDYHFKAGDSVRIAVIHVEGTRPRMLNPEVR